MLQQESMSSGISQLHKKMLNNTTSQQRVQSEFKPHQSKRMEIPGIFGGIFVQ